MIPVMLRVLATPGAMLPFSRVRFLRIGWTYFAGRFQCFSDPVLRWEVPHREQHVLASGTFRIVTLFRLLWLELVLLHDPAVSLEASLRVPHR